MSNTHRHDGQIILSGNSLDEHIIDEIPELRLPLTVDPGHLAAYSDDRRCPVGIEFREAVAAHEGVPFENTRSTGSLLAEIAVTPARLGRNTVVTLGTDFPQYRRQHALKGCAHVEIPVSLDTQEVNASVLADAVRDLDAPAEYAATDHGHWSGTRTFQP